MPEKPLKFVGRAREDLRTFPAEVRSRIGHDLYMLQMGREPSDWKPMEQVGAGAIEIRARDPSGAWRVIVAIRVSEAVYVLHAFQKKSRRTPTPDLELARRRHGLVVNLRRGRIDE